MLGKIFLWGFGMSQSGSPTLNYSESDHSLIFVFQHQHLHMAHKVFVISEQSFTSEVIIP